MARIRKTSHHRGWSPKQLTPESKARDIANSILEARMRGESRHACQYTANTEIISLVESILMETSKLR